MVAIRATILAFAVFLSVSCGKPADPETELLHSARTAYITGENLTAEDLYQKYLQGYPDGGYRLEAWNRLCDIAVNLRKDKAGAVPLIEAMLLEYGADANLRPELLRRAAQLQADLHEYPKACEYFEKYLGEAGVPPTDRNTARQLLAKLYELQRREDDSLRVLRECHAEKDPGSVFLDCKLESANLLVRMQQYDAAAASLMELRDQVSAGSLVWSRAGFLLGEIYEHNHENDKAVAMYQSILDSFPNPQAVRSRLTTLKK